jgi:hypothetical protein
MPINRFRRLATATVLALAAMIVAALPASAQVHDLELDPGVACDFGLGLDGLPGFPPERKTFTDAAGNPIVVLLAGKSGAVTYTNLDTNKSATFPSRGTAFRTTNRPDGTFLWEFSGNFGIILFPTDNPPGPSTTQISGGRLVIENSAPDPTGFFVSTVLQQVGKQTDVCAALS